MIRISAISYLNSLPFIWCLERSKLIGEFKLSYDTPSQCADKLLNNNADIGLIPTVETLVMPQHYIISDLCIGADNTVRTVVLASEKPLSEVSTVYLDCHSRTSVALTKILAKHYWKIAPDWINFAGDIMKYPRHSSSAAVVIGDKAFEMQAPYIIDLAGEWRKFTGLPFVFACWTANKPIAPQFIKRFNEAFEKMNEKMSEIAEYYKNKAPDGVDLLEYWTNNISYQLTDEKRNGLKMFLKYASEMR